MKLESATQKSLVEDLSDLYQRRRALARDYQEKSQYVTDRDVKVLRAQIDAVVADIDFLEFRLRESLYDVEHSAQRTPKPGKTGAKKKESE